MHHEYFYPLHKSFHMLQIASCPPPTGTPVLFLHQLDSTEVTSHSLLLHLSAGLQITCEIAALE
jgi:hypothetical protein